MRIMGVDPGLGATGFGVIESDGRLLQFVAGGVITPLSKERPLEYRLEEIYTALQDLLAQHQPAALSLEEIYTQHRYPRTAVLMGHARGVVALAAAQAGVPLFHYQATQVKSVLTGDGHATKEQVQRAVQMRLALSTLPRPHHMADALALALCHADALRAAAAWEHREGS